MPEPAPAAKPAEPTEEAEDLFKEPEAEKKPAEPPAETPAEPPAKSDDVEDLFKETDDKKAAASEPAPEEPMEKATDSEVEDLFSDPSDKPAKSAQVEELPAPEVQAVASKPIQLSSAQSPMRLWTDNTGRYHVRARLVVVGDKYVRLLKDTGKYTTVRIERLSGSDLAFVRHQVSSVVAGNF